MLWKGRRESGNVDDRRGMSGGKMVAGGGVLGIIVLVINFLMSDGDLSKLQVQIPQQQVALSPEEQAADDERAAFVKVVLAETEDVWNKVFKENNSQYIEPTLVLFRGSVQSGCGGASAEVGPFYCPADEKLYIDLSFYQDLQEKLQAPGDFPMAYVVAHEVGHHIQKLLGVSEKMQRIREEFDEKEYNKYSVMMELQADFYAGVWAHYTEKMKNNLEEGDIQEALTAANAIGDDRLQKQGQGYVVPDAFTHGTSEQRMYWFSKGYKTGDLSQGDTFKELAD
ncbi:MAG: neutral zinc metallopeptidase [Bacteroidota bacterium]